MPEPSAVRINDDPGFGLVEIVVSMFILGLLAISFLPLLIQGVRVAAHNQTVATATQLIHQETEQARTKATCDALVAGTFASGDFDITRVVEHFDDNSLDPCDIDGDGDVDGDDFPGVVKLTLSITETGSTDVIVEATTLVLVHSEN